jgi:putative MFS transporter
MKSEAMRETMRADSDVVRGMQTNIDELSARLERLPICSWHSKARLMLGIATFFDAFDALAIAQVLPALVPLWKLSSGDVGLLIATGYAGQLSGAVFFGWLAGRIGRLRAVSIAIAIFAAMSVVCGFASSYQALLVARLVQGFGLGGEVPVAAVYISEVTRAKTRGRFLLLYEFIFTVGVFLSGLVGTVVVPRFGWEWMFFIGALPIIVAPVLTILLPESPRWLASRGRLRDADAATLRIEKAVQRATRQQLPPVTHEPRRLEVASSWRDYFADLYLPRTVVLWSIWFGSYIVYYGLGTWMPTLYRTVFHLPLAQSLHYALITNACGVAAVLTSIFTVDTIGRKPMFLISFFGCAASFSWLYVAGISSLSVFIASISIAYYFATLSAIVVYLYTPECYPTRARAQGMGMATAWCRLASMLGPAFVGMVVKTSLSNVFLAFAVVAVFVGLIVIALAPETKGYKLEEISP